MAQVDMGTTASVYGQFYPAARQREVANMVMPATAPTPALRLILT